MSLRTVAAAGTEVWWIAHAELWGWQEGASCAHEPATLICSGNPYRVGWSGSAGYYVFYPLDGCTTDLPRSGFYFGVVAFDSAGTGNGSPRPYVSVNSTPCLDWYNDGSGWAGVWESYLLSMVTFFRCTGEVPVELSSLQAVASPAEVRLTWRTESESENLGFNVYRASCGERIRINEWLIPGAGTSLSPHEYRFTDRDVSPGAVFRYWVSDVAFGGAETFHGPVVVMVPEDRPAELGLTVDGSSEGLVVRMGLPTEGHTRLAVYDLSGHEVAVLVNQTLGSGTCEVTWDGSIPAGMAARGVYIVRLVHTSGVITTKAVLR